MPWPPAVHRLLAAPRSREGDALRWGLVGLAAGLEAVRGEMATDPSSAESSAAADLCAVLSEMRELLDGVGPVGTVGGAEPPGRPTAAADAEADAAGPAPKLLGLARAVAD